SPSPRGRLRRHRGRVRGSGAGTWIDHAGSPPDEQPAIRPSRSLDREALPGKDCPPMAGSRLTELPGSRGRIVVHEWPREHPRYVALIAHGYGEHAQRYAHVADHVVRHGAAVYAPDHLGHGRSEGERALVERVDDMVDDLDAVARKASGDHPDVLLVLIGHSM